MNKEDAISSIGLFSGLEDHCIKQIARATSIKKYPPQSVIIQEGDLNCNLFFVIKGKVKVTSTHFDGREIVLNMLSKGEFVSNIYNPSNHKCRASIIAISNAELIVIGIDAFRNLNQLFPKILFIFIKEILTEIKKSENRLLLLSIKSAKQRIATLIIKIAETEGRLVNNTMYIDKLPPRLEIGFMTGLARETVSRVLNGFQKQKLVKLSKLKLTITDYKKFKKVFLL